jgi:hypothetical protein
VAPALKEGPMDGGLLFDFVMALLRWGLTVGMAVLVKKHVLTPEQGDHFTEQFATHLAIVAGLLLTLAWALLSKYWTWLKMRLALQLPAGTGYGEVIDHLLRGETQPTPPRT